MTRDEFQTQLDDLALSLESAVSLSTTRIEHIRVSAHASRARALAEVLRRGRPAETPTPQPTAVSFSAA
jgi:hypothetical protein